MNMRENLPQILWAACLLVICSIFLYSGILNPSPDLKRVEEYLEDNNLNIKDSDLEDAVEVKSIQNPRHRKKQRKIVKFTGSTGNSETSWDKLFAYYMLAPQCIPDNLLFKSALGNASRLDIYVNCYVSLCFENLRPHITYILNTSTTWTSGRNLLFNYVKASGRKYKYHIFMDDDVDLFYTEHLLEYAKRNGKASDDANLLRMYELDPLGLKEGQLEVRDGKTAWRAFEDDLLKHSPGFSTTNLLKMFGFESRKVQAYHWNERCPSNRKPMPWITTTFFIDAIFIAYHDEAMALLFPHTELFDQWNWWTSAIIQCFRARELLFKQGMCNYRIAVINKIHREYPHRRIPDHMMRLYIEREAPELRNVLDHRFLDYAPFQKWAHYERVFYGDPAVCTGPLKFPIAKHYKVQV